jgi:hypothetical protein
MDINIEERIKELQKDSKFFFKQTEEIIDIIYRQAIQDCTCELPSKDFTDELAKEINNKIIDDVIFKVKENEGRDLKEELDEALKVVKSQDEKIEEQEQKIKKLNSQIYDLKEKQKKSFPKRTPTPGENDRMDNQFQSGMVTGLKFAIMAMEGHNIQEAYATIVKKYNEVVRPQKEYWP